MLYPDTQARLQCALEHQAELGRNFQQANFATGRSARRRCNRRSSLLARVLRRRGAPRPAIGAS
jgi:hypothetical protein